MRHVVIDRFMRGDALVALNAQWPDGWESGRLPEQIAHALLQMAAINVGAILGLEYATAPDVGLSSGAGPFTLRRGEGVAVQEAARLTPHPILGCPLAWSATLFVHQRWCDSWDGALTLEGTRSITPEPGRLVLIDWRQGSARVETVRCPLQTERRSLALYGYGWAG